MRNFNFSQIWESFIFAVQFLPQTLLLVFVPFLFCLFFGLLIAVIRTWRIPVLSQVLQVVVTIVKGIPVYLLLIVSNLLYILYFDKAAAFLGLPFRTANINILYFAMFILIFSFTPGISEIWRGAMLAVPLGQYEAGQAAGLTRLQILRRIVLPQTIPEVIPGMTSMLIGLLKASALAYMVGVTEILNASIRAASISYNLLEGYIAAAIIYWALSIGIEKGMSVLAQHVGKFRKPLSV